MQRVKPYYYFSKLYPHLMKSVNYRVWADYIFEIHQTLGSPYDIGLEIGSGLGQVGHTIRGEFKKLYLSDSSHEMLKMSKKSCDLICCDMVNLPFKIKFDFIFSIFDTINYLNTEEMFEDFFSKIKFFLNNNKYFTFDVSLENNSIKNVNELNRSGSYKGIDYIQKSEFNTKSKIHTNQITIRTMEGEEFIETHNQKIYDFYYYFEVIEKSGLFVSECFDAFSFEDGTPESDRLQFIVKGN